MCINTVTTLHLNDRGNRFTKPHDTYTGKASMGHAGRHTTQKKHNTKTSPSSSSSVIMQCRALWPTSHTLPALQPLTWALLMTGNQLRHTGHPLPCPLCQVTTPKTANGREPWVSQWVKETESCIVWSTRCVCVRVKAHRMYITTSDSRLAGLNISCRYELTVKFSCPRPSWVRVSAIVSSRASQRIERNSTAWSLVRVESLSMSSLLTFELIG